MLKNKPEVWISDITHNVQGISAATFPLGASHVYTFTKELLGEYIDLKLFKFTFKTKVSGHIIFFKL
jgi:hypothetical protein